jgi:hypothetical protein
MNLITYIDHLLRDREQVISDMQDPQKAPWMTRVSFVIFVLLSALYGLIMGSQSLVHGYGAGWRYSVGSAIKMPMLFLLTLAICLPLLYVLNVLIGPRAQWGTIFTLIIASFAVTSIILASCALILAFFMLSTKSYAFITLLNTGIFTLAGLYGVWFLGKSLSGLTPPDRIASPRNNTKTIIRWWLFTYGIVGTQMAWLMRPFIGGPGMPFSFFRPQESNFYLAVGKALGRLLMGG